jgi:hypothetical protein
MISASTMSFAGAECQIGNSTTFRSSPEMPWPAVLVVAEFLADAVGHDLNAENDPRAANLGRAVRTRSHALASVLMRVAGLEGDSRARHPPVPPLPSRGLAVPRGLLVIKRSTLALVGMAKVAAISARLRRLPSRESI